MLGGDRKWEVSSKQMVGGRRWTLINRWDLDSKHCGKWEVGPPKKQVGLRLSKHIFFEVMFEN